MIYRMFAAGIAVLTIGLLFASMQMLANRAPAPLRGPVLFAAPSSHPLDYQSPYIRCRR